MTAINSIFNNANGASTTFNIYSNPTSYDRIFNNAATQSDALITVNYKSITTNIDI